MSNLPIEKRLSRGVFLSHITAGNEKGGFQRAYRTPQFPEGRTEGELRVSSIEAQRNVACFWFLSNFKPYDLSGGIWFSFGVSGRGFGQAPFAPSPLTCISILDVEFSDTIAPETRRAVAEVFPDKWMRIEDAYTEQNTLNASSSVAELQTLILSRLDHLATEVRQLRPFPVGLGHNLPPSELPITSAEQDEALAAIEHAKTAVLTGDPVGVEQFRTRLSLLTAKLGYWSLGKLDAFASSFAQAAGTGLGGLVPVVLVGGYLLLWHNSQSVDELLKLLLEHLK